MKNINEFVGYQLSKTQMNSLCGGAQWDCTVGGELVAFVKADSQKDAEDYISKIYGEAAKCTKR